jgi:hypothetical protein
LQRKVEPSVFGESLLVPLDVHVRWRRLAEPAKEKLRAPDVIVRQFVQIDVERLLSVARPPEQRTFQTWFLSEFVHQHAGRTPLAWSAAPAFRAQA